MHIHDIEAYFVENNKQKPQTSRLFFRFSVGTIQMNDELKGPF